MPELLFESTFYGTSEMLICSDIQSNFNDSNTLGTMKICLRQKKFELMSVNRSAKTGGKVDISLRFSLI